MKSQHQYLPSVGRGTTWGMDGSAAGTPAPPPAGLAREDGQVSSSPFQPFMGMTGVLCCDRPASPPPPSERGRVSPFLHPWWGKKKKPSLLTFTPSAHTCSPEVILPVWEREFTVRFNLDLPRLGLSGCEGSIFLVDVWEGGIGMEHGP